MSSYDESDWERREQDLAIDQPASGASIPRLITGEQALGEELNAWEIREHSGLSVQELRRLKTTTPQRVFYLVAAIALLLLLIMGILGAYVFHW